MQGLGENETDWVLNQYMGDYINQINNQNQNREKWANKKVQKEYINYLRQRDDPLQSQAYSNNNDDFLDKSIKMANSEGGRLNLKGLPGGLNARYNQEEQLRESIVSDSQQTKSTVFARVPRSSCNDIRLADLLMQSGQRVLNGGMKSFSI